MVDLHAHTTESDGSTTPEQLVRMAEEMGLDALGVTDHDTFAGYDKAAAVPRRDSLELVCGIELSTRLHLKGQHWSRSAHMLGYWMHTAPPDDFRRWLKSQEESRRDRNRRMAARLQALGLDVQLEDVERLGRARTGRPHFARVLVSKGYVATIQEAFRVYLGETAKAYVHRDEPATAEVLERIANAGGISSLAHPVRLPGEHLDEMFGELSAAGLRAIEAWHSDHSPQAVERLMRLAERYGLGLTGGSDYHGANKPGVALGTGANGNLAVPGTVLEGLRALVPRGPRV